MWTSLISTVKKVNDGICNELQQEFNCKMESKLAIQLSAEKHFYNELNQLCKDPGIKMENDNGNDCTFKRQKLMEAHLSLIKSIEQSFQSGMIKLLNNIMRKQNNLYKELNTIADEHNLSNSIGVFYNLHETA